MARPIGQTGLIYSRKPKHEGALSYKEIAEKLGDTNYVTVGNILNRAFKKIAREVFIGLNDREPTKLELNNLSRNEEFQLLVVEMLEEKK